MYATRVTLHSGKVSRRERSAFVRVLVFGVATVLPQSRVLPLLRTFYSDLVGGKDGTRDLQGDSANFSTSVLVLLIEGYKNGFKCHFN